MKKSIFMAALVICLAGSTAFSQNTRAIIFQNDLGFTINGIYMEPTGLKTSVWGPNIYTLDNTWYNGNNFSYTMFPNSTTASCTYDVKYTGDNGIDYVVKNVDICSTSPIILTR